MRPTPVFAVFVLFLNDHILKHAWPGWITGKLSDVAGMTFFPVLLTTLAAVFVARARRDDATFDRMLLVACIATAVAFAATKTIPSANEAYRVVWGAMLWPVRALRSVGHGHGLPGFARVVLVRDPSDLLALPFVLLAWRTGRRTSTASAAIEERVGTSSAETSPEGDEHTG